MELINRELKTDWIRCPVCGNKTRDRIREDTILKNYLLYCPKCRQETNHANRSDNDSVCGFYFSLKSVYLCFFNCNSSNHLDHHRPR